MMLARELTHNWELCRPMEKRSLWLFSVLAIILDKFSMGLPTDHGIPCFSWISVLIVSKFCLPSSAYWLRKETLQPLQLHARWTQTVGHCNQPLHLALHSFFYLWASQEDCTDPENWYSWDFLILPIHCSMCYFEVCTCMKIKGIHSSRSTSIVVGKLCTGEIGWLISGFCRLNLHHTCCAKYSVRLM